LMQLNVMDGLTSSLIDKVAAVAAGIASICFVCSLAHNYFKSSFKALFTQDTSEFPNYMEIGRGVVMIVCIASYPAIAQVLGTSIEFFNSKTTSSLAITETANKAKSEITKSRSFTWEDTKNEAINAASNSTPTTQTEKDQKEYAQHVLNKNEDAPSDQDVSSSGIKSSLLDIGAAIDSLPDMIINAMAHIVVGLIHILVAAFAVIMFKMLLIIGPLAFAFSILPCFEKQLSHWFGTLLNVGFVFTTLNIMEHITCSIYTYIGGTSNTPGKAGDVLILDLVVIFSTCSCFWLTSKFVGKGDSGRVLSKIVQTAATAATLAVGASAAKGGNLSQLTNIGQSTLINNSK